MLGDETDIAGREHIEELRVGQQRHELHVVERGGPGALLQLMAHGAVADQQVFEVAIAARLFRCGEDHFQSLFDPHVAGVSDEEVVLRADAAAKFGATALRRYIEQFGPRPIREQDHLLGRDSLADDFFAHGLGQGRDQFGAAIAGPFDCIEKIDQTPRFQHSKIHRGVRLQIGNVLDEGDFPNSRKCDRTQAQRQRWSCHDQEIGLVRDVSRQRAQKRSGDERRFVQNSFACIHLRRHVHPRTNDGDAIALFTAEQAPAIPGGNLPRRIVGKSGEHGNAMAAAGEVLAAAGGEGRDAGFIRPIIYPEKREVHYRFALLDLVDPRSRRQFKESISPIARGRCVAGSAGRDCGRHPERNDRSRITIPASIGVSISAMKQLILARGQ